MTKYVCHGTATPECCDYIVTTQCWNGKAIHYCMTENEAWDAVGQMAFGGLYTVSSPTGKNTYDFIPF